MKRRVVFAGDSIVHGGPWQYWLPDHYVTNFAFPGHTTADMSMLVDDIVESQPELLIVMIGTNDFGKYRLPIDEVIQNILNVAKKIKVNLANIPVIWHSLTPRSDEFSQSMIEVNEKIRPELEKLDVFNVWDDIFIFLIPSKFNGYKVVNVFNGNSKDTYDVFKLKPNILPIENVLSV